MSEPSFTPGIDSAVTTLKVSAYERVSTWLISLVLLVGTGTGCLLLLWLGQTLRYERPVYQLSVEEEEGYGRGDNPAGFARDSKAPGDPDLPMLDEPAGSEVFELTEPDPLASLAMVADVTSAVIAEVGDVAIDAIGPSARTPGFGGTGGGEGGLGDSRPPGPMGDGVAVVPRYERWQVRFASTSVQAYAAQLDSFKIELAALGGTANVDYAFNLTKPTPDRRSGPPKTEKRLYMTWQAGTLKEFDRQLLSRAGIQTDGRLMVQFYPKPTEDRLASLEVQNAPGKSKREFAKTIFGVKSVGSGFDFYVIDQRFRWAPK